MKYLIIKNKHLYYQFTNIVRSANINLHLFYFYLNIEMMTRHRPISYLYTRTLLKINNNITKIFLFKY